ncbi:MAG: helix-turn-helix transcriptional regulator, partial [Clostridia bacterium]|nr:helix-turn-helix transcriptional regulator [Clostridia bacterium]
MTSKITLKSLREKHENLTQKQLASFLHVDRSAISKWETGKQAPDRDMAMKIARFFDVTFSEVEEMFIKKNIEHDTNNSSWLNKQLSIEELK